MDINITKSPLYYYADRGKPPSQETQTQNMSSWTLIPTIINPPSRATLVDVQTLEGY